MKYEIMYIICLNIDEEVKIVLVECFDIILKDNGVEVIEFKDWEKCCLVYEMNGFCEGIYYIVNVIFLLIVGVINEFDCLVKINDDIICYMIVKVEV